MIASFVTPSFLRPSLIPSFKICLHVPFPSTSLLPILILVFCSLHPASYAILITWHSFVRSFGSSSHKQFIQFFQRFKFKTEVIGISLLMKDSPRTPYLVPSITTSLLPSHSSSLASLLAYLPPFSPSRFPCNVIYQRTLSLGFSFLTRQTAHSVFQMLILDSKRRPCGFLS